MKHHIRLIILCLGVMLPGLVPDDAALAVEARCTELGANCVCSEPLQMTSFTTLGGGYYHNPSDSSTQECNGELTGGQIGYAITRDSNGAGGNDYTGSTDATALAALPSGHSVARFLKAVDGSTGIASMGHVLPGVATYSKRAAFRWYTYHTSDYGFDDDPAACDANKLAQTDGHPTNNAAMIVDLGFGPVALYNFLTFQDGTGSQDCCGYGQLNGNTPSATLISMGGPSTSGVSPYYQYWRGKWVRWEMVITNRDSGTSGIPVTFKLYVKNVTDNGSEYLLADSCDTDGGLTTPCGHIPAPSVQFNKMLTNNYRQGTCPGWRGISHYMVAGWDTDSNQRIGAAVEVEGSGAQAYSSSFGGGFRMLGVTIR